MRRTIKAIIALVIVAATSGCATIGREDIRRSHGYARWYYPATRENCRTLAAPSDDLLFAGVVEKPCAVLDLPFSLLFDTVLWPVDFVDGNFGRPHVRPKNKDDGNRTSH